MVKCPFCGNEVEKGRAIAVLEVPAIEEDINRFQKRESIFLRLGARHIPLVMFECDKCENVFFRKPGKYTVEFGEVDKG